MRVRAYKNIGGGGMRWGGLAIAAALFVIGAGMLPGCGGARGEKARAEGPVLIEFWHSMTGRQGQSLLEIVAEFNKQHPDIRVVPVYQGSYDSLSQKLVASCMSGSNPPMAQMYESWTTRFMNRNLITAVEDLDAESPPEESAHLEDIMQAFREDNSWIVEGRPKLMTLPFNKSIYVLYINEDRMREVGYDHPPKDWDEWRNLAEKMTLRNPDGSIRMYGFATRPLLESFTINLFLNGCHYIDENGEFDFAGQRGEEALSFLVNMAYGEKRSAYVESDYLNTAFGAQRIAMYVGSTASFPYNEQAVAGRFTWRAYPLPTPKGVEGRALCQGTNVGIFANHPREIQRAAWTFLRVMTNTENTVKWSMDTGYLPVRYSALEHPRMKKYLEDNVNFRNALSQIDRGLFEPKEIYWESVRLALARETESALMGRKTPRQALDDGLAKCLYIRDTE